MVPVCNRLPDVPLAGWGEWDFSLGWKSSGRRHHGCAPMERGAARIIPAAPLRKQLNDALLTITGALIGFEGFEGGERGMHSQYYLP